MKIIFAGTPHFAAAALTAIHAAGHEIALVLTQPDRPAGRGLKLTASAVADEAARLGLPIAKPASLKTPEAHALIQAVNADVMVVAAYGLLLPQAVLDMPKRGCINIHGSLLPRWRGAAPVQRAIEAGDTETGIGIMQMEAGLDTGPVLLERPIAIAPDDTSASLFAKLTTLGAKAIVEALSALDALTPKAQSAEGVTYAKKIEKTEAAIRWADDAELIARRIRAFDPFPGMETQIGASGANADGTKSVPLLSKSHQKLKIWRVSWGRNALNASPGLVIASTTESLVIACGSGTLSLEVVQLPGGKRLSIADFLRANPIPIGTYLS
jgi:methionyl-tRNA formyltransferase